MTTILVDRAQLEQWLQAFKKIHGDKRSHWDVDEEISAIEKSLEPIAMDVMKTDEADFWRWWKPYQLKDCWRLELVARDAWMAAKATKQQTEQHARNAITWTPDTGYVFSQPKEPEQEPVAWKLVPTEPTDEMLKAMDECSTEGYDERLYAGHAASVYMAAVDVAPTPPKPEQERCVGCEACIDTACGRDECPNGWPKAAQPEQEPVAWVPYLSDRADGVKGRYAIARWNPRGYREVWNLRRHEWGAYSDDVLSLEEADTLLRLITIPTRKVTSPQPPQPKEPEQEPTKLWCDTCEGTGEVYQEHQAGCHVGGHFKCPDCDGEGYVLSRLYSTTPPPVAELHKRKPLTDEQIDKAWRSVDYTVPWEQHRIDIARAIEAAHGIKE